MVQRTMAHSRMAQQCLRRLSLLLVGCIGTAGGSVGWEAACWGEDILVEDCYVSPLNDVDVPAEAQGVIHVLDVDEGQTVVAGQGLATIDDREAQINKDLAKIGCQGLGFGT